MYIQFNNIEEQYNLRSLIYNHISNGVPAKELNIDFDETDINLASTIADLKTLANTGIDKIIVFNDSNIKIYDIVQHFKIDSLQDSIYPDGRRNVSLRLIQEEKA